MHIPMEAMRAKITIRESVDSLCRDNADMPNAAIHTKSATAPNTAFVSLIRWLTVILECFLYLRSLTKYLETVTSSIYGNRPNRAKIKGLK